MRVPTRHAYRGRMTDQHLPDPDPAQDDADARLGGAEDAAVDERAEALRSRGIMPDLAAMREDDRDGSGD